MTETIIASLIAAASAVVVCMINNSNQNKAVEAKHDKTIALIEQKLGQLEKKQDLHNNAVERLFNVETRLAVAENSLKTAHHRIDDMKEEMEQ